MPFPPDDRTKDSTFAGCMQSQFPAEKVPWSGTPSSGIRLPRTPAAENAPAASRNTRGYRSPAAAETRTGKKKAAEAHAHVGNAVCRGHFLRLIFSNKRKQRYFCHVKAHSAGEDQRRQRKRQIGECAERHEPRRQKQRAAAHAEHQKQPVIPADFCRKSPPSTPPAIMEKIQDRADGRCRRGQRALLKVSARVR